MCRSRPRILVLSTLGSGSNDENRIRDLLSGFSIEVFPFDRRYKLRMMRQLMRTLWNDRPDLVVMEGSGSAGGIPLILFRWLRGLRYVVSSGDAIGPWVSSHSRWLGWPFAVYEKMLCRWSAGFIGWTPYLVGRALTYGAPRSMTAAGWAPFQRTAAQLAEARIRIRNQWQIPQDAIVIGIAGSMHWTNRYGYCYGAELVRSMLQLDRSNVFALLVGDGTGRPKLEKLAGSKKGSRVVFTGRIRQEEVPDYLAAMDLGSLPQSVDQTGAFRYTTKISEYISCALPVVTGHVPMGYDLDEGWVWRIPGFAPWDQKYIDSLTSLLSGITAEDISQKKLAMPISPPLFSRELQIRRATAFIGDLLDLIPERQS